MQTFRLDRRRELEQASRSEFSALAFPSPVQDAFGPRIRQVFAKTGFDVAQTFSVNQLRESHRERLIPAREILYIRTAAIASYTLLEFFVGQMLDQLGEDRLAKIDGPLSQP